MACSNVVTGVVNFLTMVLALPIIAFGIWLAKKGDSECVKFLQWPVIVLGVFVLVVSMAGLFGSWCGNRCLMYTYLFVMFLLILLLFIFTIFAFVVTNSGAGRAVSGKGFKEYKLGDYSNWMRNRVDNPKYWIKIKSCLADAKVCSDLKKYTSAASFNSAKLTPLEVCSLLLLEFSIVHSQMRATIRKCSITNCQYLNYLKCSGICDYCRISPYNVAEWRGCNIGNRYIVCS